MEKRRKTKNDNLVEYLEHLTGNLQKVEDGVEITINETVKKEINLMFEALKREYQEMWNLSVKYSKSKVDDLGITYNNLNLPLNKQTR